MLTMERKYRYLFTLCLIIGFQIHVPVTMHPAIPDLHDMPGLSENFPVDLRSGKDADIAGKIKDKQSVNTINNIGSFAPGNINIDRDVGYRPSHVVEYTLQRQTVNEHENHNTENALHAGEHNILNAETNQAGPQNPHGHTAGQDLLGLRGSLDSNQLKSTQSGFNRISSDLVGVRLKQVQARLSNLSEEISARRTAVNRQEKQNNIEDNRQTEHITNNEKQSIQMRNDNAQGVGKSKLSKSSKNNIIKGVIWSKDLENICPESFTESHYVDWKRKVDSHDVIKMEEGCGSMQNRLVTFNDSSTACVRYRMNTELMQGDIYSFYLGQLLNLRYTPPSALTVPVNSKQWRRVKSAAREAGWSEHKPAILSRYIPDIGQVYIPHELRNESSQLRPGNYWLENRPTAELCEFVQWTDLVVFDYICGNLDRVVNNLSNLKWNSKMLEKPIHNLMKIKSSGLFLYLDNESGLFHGYRLLDSYAGYHKKLLESVCVFRKSTVDAIERLHRGGNAGEELQNLYQTNEQFHGSLPRMSKKTMDTLQSRVADVYKHIQLCKNTFSDIHSNR